MVERLKKLLQNQIDGEKYLINYQKIDSKELFFIKDKLDMNRAKSVEHCSVTLYKEVVKDGEKFLGSSVFKVSPSMTDEEVINCIKTGLYSASLVNNPMYELVKPSGKVTPKVKSNLSFENGAKTMQQVIDIVYDIDKQSEANVNSMEIFLEDTLTKVINSEGVDESFKSPKLIIELVVDCDGEKESVELYDMIEVNSFDEKMLREKIGADFDNVQKRAKAKELSNVSDIPVVLKGEAVCEIFSYYTFKANALALYKKYSQLNIGDNVQGDNIKGDKISITLMPDIPFSINSRYVDSDGVAMEDLPLYENGKLLSYYGNSRYSQYLNTNATGNIPNVKVHAGSVDCSDMTVGECLEVIGFSDFQMDSITGDFGGEIRLAIHHKDGNAYPVTGGSVTGNITKVHDNIILSKQMDVTGSNWHPKAVKIEGTKISS